MKRGIFWVIENKVFAFVFEEGATVGVAKSGNNYNHRLLWDSVKPPKCNKPYNYYPRGRVEITGGGKTVIYMNPHIGMDHIPEIRRQFGIDTEPKIHYDGSRHYRCNMDIETDC